MSIIIVSKMAAWTRRVLLSIRTWLLRTPGLVMYFHLTQVLTGHRCFCSFLFKRKRENSRQCLWCPEGEEDAEHTLFHCDRRIANRIELTVKIGFLLAPENMQRILCRDARIHMLEDERLGVNITDRVLEMRIIFINMKEVIMKDKEDERRRQVNDRTASMVARRRQVRG